jgi:DNA polymerase I-like protein with 3'-5' exonuclease and polymerase domains
MTMRHVYFDTETDAFSPGYMAPDVVCLQFCHDTGPAEIVHAGENRDGVYGRVRDWLRDSSVQLVGQNIAYDLACLAAGAPDLYPLIFAAYEANRVTDTMLRQKLADISRGRYRTRQYDLASCAEIHDYVPADGQAAFKTNDKGKKIDPWRTRYGELRRVALKYWPRDAVRYALNDATATRHVHQSQADRYAQEWFCDEFNQARKFLCLRLMEVWGIRTDVRGVESLQIGAVEEIERTRELLADYGLVRQNRDGTWSRNVNAARARVIEAYKRISKEYPRPKARKVKGPDNVVKLVQSVNAASDNDACMQSDDYVLEQYAVYSQMTKVLSADVPMLARGIDYPIHTHFDIVESGRTSSASPNIQNPRRMTGVRECFVPRAGNVFVDADMSALELRTVAQTCLKVCGFSRLADVLNAGRDPHTALAAQMLGWSYEDTDKRKKEPDIDNMRTAAKGMNFGFPGGLGASSFPAYAWRAYKVRVTEEQVAEWKAQWLEQFPEFRPYHRFIGETYEHSGVKHLFTNRMRGRVTFTSAANSYFQGLGADVCGGALFAVTRACYTDRRSALYGSRPVNFMHDSILTETPYDNAHEALAEQERLMLEGGAPFLPDVPPKVDGKAMTRWSKDAQRLTQDGTKRTRVVPWSPWIPGETCDDYAARCRLPRAAVDEAFAIQVKAYNKQQAKKQISAEKAARFLAELAGAEDEDAA